MSSAVRSSSTSLKLEALVPRPSFSLLSPQKLRHSPSHLTPAILADTMAETRDVSNHVLFEVATEVANRGTRAPHITLHLHILTPAQLVVSTQSSSPRLRSPRPSMAPHTHCWDHGIELRYAQLLQMHNHTSTDWQTRPMSRWSPLSPRTLLWLPP